MIYLLNGNDTIIHLEWKISLNRLKFNYINTANILEKSSRRQEHEKILYLYGSKKL